METHESIEELEAKAHEMLRRATELRHAKLFHFDPGLSLIHI